jgi:hypothetical protein
MEPTHRWGVCINIVVVVVAFCLRSSLLGSDSSAVSFTTALRNAISGLLSFIG